MCIYVCTCVSMSLLSEVYTSENVLVRSHDYNTLYRMSSKSDFQEFW